jgi:nucleotide-binding universal stress UspA family protein
MSNVNLGSIFHPSDFSEASAIAFAHALKIALVTRATLNIMHVEADRYVDWSDFPGVRAMLAQWRLLPEGSPRSAVNELGMNVRKVISASKDPVKACLDFLSSHPADLIVLAVHQHEGRMHWLQQRVGEPISRKAGETTLFVPHGVSGFVSREDGSVSLRNILIPIAHTPHAQPAVDAAARLIRSLELASGTVHLLHVGSPAQAPTLTIPQLSGWTANQVSMQGEADAVILQIAEQIDADLIMMTTEGPHGFLDALRGSTSERVLRRSHCPVASLPAQPG